MTPTLENIQGWFKNLQNDICHGLEKLDGKATFQEDNWIRPGGGGGRTRVIEEGTLLAKGGVNFSHVYGEMPQKLLQVLELPAVTTSNKEEKHTFNATGVSIVLHPQSPMVPIIHMNVRYFEMSNGLWWFGGGIDLTPHYVDGGLARAFHQKLKAVCDKFDVKYYPAFKKWADDYFYIPHRQETRGIGGIFFDRLRDTDGFTKEQRWKFVQAVGSAFVELYTHQAQQTRELPFGQKEKNWQLLRRGRYVEFNLVWDRGTKFGLQTNGRTESILMSLPPQANWAYNHVSPIESKEQQTLDLLKKDIDWANWPVLATTEE